MDKGSQSIAVACDGSEQSVKAAKLAGQLAEATGQPLKLLAVFPESRLEILSVRGTEPANIEADRENFGRKAFDAAKGATGDKVAAEEILITGDPAHEIIEYMEANPGTHLILGRRGYSPMRSLTLGSVSEKIVRHATGPVTVVGE